MRPSKQTARMAAVRLLLQTSSAVTLLLLNDLLIEVMWNNHMRRTGGHPFGLDQTNFGSMLSMHASDVKWFA
jgi:hypothetical protein